ncbi:MBL fold metallo-hydrolase [Paenibacillus sp. LHD-117]|uniref:MBL fold metallo-hydrolase n=1 Tax=Paenibacillus sp. LHD-117 TaxID=3071412 RepID=UPI0027E05BD6|nr:MBL fold metallo-hydrolase [Paenibacillus sp. LHD-117]MDQ6418803.1 MBL fold metallo-hydrolase [Paenibacillus sp. LHD-117]
MFVALIVIGIILVIAAAVPLAQRIVPAFGGRLTRRDSERYRSLPHYDGGKFRYPIETKMNTSFKEMLPVAWEFLKGSPKRKPSSPMPVVSLGREDLKQGGGPRAIWFGHSAALLQLDGLTILFDPMFGSAPSPFPAIGGKRFGGKLPMALADLPKIDYVLISHDHYDHLDYPSIMAMKSKVGHFFVPLGVGSHLKRWGVDEASISELDWWEEREAGGLKLACAPARHFSGRGSSNRDSTLWCSWAIRGSEANVFFCGDSGYGPHFREIGERFGPFDLTMMECGQYDEKWAAIHMLPEQTVQAHEDVKGELLLPIHWGGFTLALHDWDDPAIRVTKEAERRGVRVTTPMIGESVPLAGGVYPNRRWWEREG